MKHISKIIPQSLAEVGNMDYLNLIILSITIIAFAAIWRLPDILKQLKDKTEDK